MSSTRERVMRKIQFHRLDGLTEGRRRDLQAPPDWVKEMRRLAASEPKDLVVDTTVHGPGVTEDGRPFLGLHQPINTNFMSQIDEASHVSDLLPQDPKAHRMANSSAVAFLPGLPIFAIGRGSSRGPGPKDVVAFLERFVPLDEGAHWSSQPVMAPDEIERFRREAKGVTKFSARFSTVRNLFTPEDAGLLQMADETAKRIGGDITVTIEMKLNNEADSGARARLFNLLKGSLPRLAADQGSRTRATAVMRDGLHEELNLVASHLGVSVDIDMSAPESQRFTTLLEWVISVGADHEDSLQP